MISKLFKWAVAITCSLPLAAMAEVQMTNPVTGETETYENIFVGTAGGWDSSSNWTLKETDKVPFVSGGNFDSALVTGKVVSTETAIDGWTLRVGAYNGATVYWSGGITKIQAGTTGCWLTADEDSVIEIRSFAGNQLEGSDSLPLKLSSAKDGGITWVGGITNATNTTLPFWYYLKGSGTVGYNGNITVANAQVIKQADITLSGTSQVASKTLVTFGSGTTKTFTADATIKRLTSLGEDLSDDAHLATITSGATTLTTADAVGTCELVQTSTAIVLYWVDGDPADLAPTVYKPSISVNFTSGTSLSTLADVGIGDYAIPGTSWNNLIGDNGSLTTVNGVDSTGASSTISGAKVTISGTRGYWTKGGLSAASDLRQAYIDDADGNATPTIVVEGIPYYSYKLVLYFSNDTDGRQFGHLTINGTNYKWDSTNSEIVTCDGTASDVWGSSSSTAYTEGGNYLVFPAMDNPDGKLTIVGHRWSGTQRMGVAAIQIVEVKPDAGANDLVIEVDGDTVYPVNEAKDLSGTVYITGFGTLTLAGEAKISADTINVGPSVTLNVNSDRLDADTFTGSGTVVYDGVVPPTGKGWTDSTWIGTVWLKNKTGITGNDVVATSVKPNSLGNVNSKVKLSGVSGWLEAPVEYNPEIVLENAGYDYALKLTNGNSPNSTETNRCTVVKKLSGSGTLCCGGTSAAVPTLKVYDASGFTGSINTVNADDAAKTGLVVVFCDEGMELPNSLVNLFINSGLKRTVYVASGKTVTLDSAATWTAATGFVVEGTLNANGTLASSASAAVTGAGTVVFNGKLPSPTGDTWWKNSAWDGTVQIKGLTGFVGSSEFTGSVLMVNDYGNADSILELNGCTGWMPYGFVEGDNVCTVPLKITGTLTINNGISNSKFTINKLLGNGTIYTDNNTATTTIQVLDSTEFTGRVQLNKKRVVFGETVPASYVIGQIYVGAGQTLTVPNSNVAWYGTGGITVDGELRAAALSNFGGGTTITTTDNGVLTLTSTGNGTEGETDTDYARITGTGSLKYEGTGWRALSTNNFPTAMTLVNEQAGDILLSRAITYTIGSLAGSKNFQGNYSSGSRYLNITQSEDTEWSGNVITDNSSRLAGFTIDAASTGTLTYSGTGVLAVPLTINGGAVNITGNWKGNTTVAGTIGGTGTLTGDLTFSDGATFKAFGTDSDGLAVSGTITYPGTGTVTVDFAEVPTADTVLLSASGLDASKFTLASGVPGGSLAVENDKLMYKSPFVTITVPAVANATASVTVGGEPVPPITEGGNSYYVIEGSAVTVTYSANDGYELSGTATYTIESAAEGSTITITDTQTAAYVVTLYTATTTKYTTLQAAVTAAADARNSKLVLLASTESESATIPAVDSAKFYVVTNVYECGTINYPAGDYIVATTSETIDISGVGEDLAATVYSATKAAVAVTVSGGERTLYDGSSIVIAVSTASAGGLGSTVEFVNGTDSAPYVSTLQAAGFTVENEVWTFTTLPVAKVTHGIGETSYLTLSDAFANAQAGDTITVLADNTLTGTIEITTDNLTLDLNGYTVTGAAGDNFMFEMKAAVGFTIKDTSTGQTGKAYSAASKVVLAGNQNCTFTLESGTLESGNSVPVYIFGDSAQYTYGVTISGGTLKSGASGGSEDNSYCIYATAGTITFTDGTIDSAVGAFRAKTVNVSGGDVTVGSDSAVCYNISTETFTYNFTGGTFNKDVTGYTADGYESKGNGDGTYTVSMAWIYAVPGYWERTGTWSEGATLGEDKVTIESNATYTASNPSAGQMVTVEMTLSFDAENDEDEDLGDVKTAVKIASGETEGSYAFKLYTTNELGRAWETATVGVTALTNVDYTFVFVLDLTNKTYKALLVDGVTTNAMSVGGSTDIPFASNENAVPVQRIDFIGAGSVTSIKGSYEDAEEPAVFVEDESITFTDRNVQLSADQAAWLNKLGAKSAVAEALATLSSDQFSSAYLLNLDLTDTFTYEFTVSDITVGDSTVEVEVTLTRTGTLVDGKSSINGTLKLMGGATFPASGFVDLHVAPVGDDDFSDGDTATWSFGKGSEKFFQPVIE